MLEKGRISSIQFYMVSIMIVIGTTILFIPGLSVGLGGRDAWLAPILAGLVGMLVMLVMIRLNKYFPEQTPVEYLQILFGKWLGGIFAAYLLWALLRFFAAMIREGTDFIITAALSRTPAEVITVLMLSVVFYVVRQGVEVISRFTQFVVVIELTQMVASVLFFSSKDVEISHLTPLFEKGFLPVLKSSFLLSGWFGELIVVGFLLPFIRVRQGTAKAGLWAVATIIVLLVISNFYTIGVFGDVIASRMQYGLYEVARYISIAEFFERLDPIVMGTWIMLMFCKLAIFCYVISLGMAQLLRFTDYRPLVSIVCVIAFTMSEHIFVNQGDMVHYFSIPYPPYGFLLEVVAPILILGFAMFRMRKEHQSV
ncbi:spore germination protein [Fodinisporobacter ferrooxydans]|uniref:Spore germination protein n=1 Tax=Fodinisporobacter ferrooxydans TaxID=2901836 RepID=A0ABY4CGP9_9BACL|nr:spore germination protein [Alicyclobacillaceae bacterium MYW30-H2]